MTETEYPYVSSVEMGTLKGEINGVTMKIQSERFDDPHSISFCLSTTGTSTNIKIRQHSVPWNNEILGDPQDYADEAHEVRETAWSALDEYNMGDKGDWHESG